MRLESSRFGSRPLYLAGCGHDDHDDHDHDHDRTGHGDHHSGGGHGDHAATSCDDSATDYVAFMAGTAKGPLTVPLRSPLPVPSP